MGSLGGEENRNDISSRKKNLNVDSIDISTQQIDSQFSPEGVLDDFLYPTSAMPVDDPYLLEDAFETQLANLAEGTQVEDLAEETQVMDLADKTQAADLSGETQIVDIAGETQVLDDIDCMISMPIEFPNEFNAEVGSVSEREETDTTDVVSETQELSQDDLVNDSSESVGLKSTADKDISREGSSYRGFTSIRAASIRASGLAAHARRANSNLCTTSSDKSSLPKDTCEQNISSVVEHSLKSDRTNDRECLQNEYNDNSEKLRRTSKCKVGSTAVRQLFREDEDDEVSDSETDNDQAGDNLNVPEQLSVEDCLAGLSYANSQEPGELSQAHALEVVDRFLDHNFMENDEGLGMRVHNTEKPKVVAAAKGSRDLARSSVLKSTVVECGIYDWNDTREVDSGGEFFSKKKEIFFPKGGPKQRYLTESKKSKNLGLGNANAVGDCVDEKERKNTSNKLGDSGHSDSGLMLRKLKSKGKSLQCEEKVLQKNLTTNMDEQLHMASEPKLAEKDTDTDVSDMINIGPDTQMAAEAMETLCFEVHLADSNSSGPNKGAHNMNKAEGENKFRKRTVRAAPNLALRRPNSVGVFTRQAKRTKWISVGESNESSLSSKQCKKFREKCDRMLGDSEERRLADVNVSSDHGTDITDQRSEEKCEVEDQLDFYVPVAHRTRKSKAVNHSKVAANSSDGRVEINDVVSTHVRGKRTAARDKNAESLTTVKVRKVVSTGFNQSNETCGALNLDAVDNLLGRRSRRNTSADIQHSERLKRSSEVATSIPVNPNGDHLKNSSACNDPALPCLDTQPKKITLSRTIRTISSRNGAAQCDSDHLNAKTIIKDATGSRRSKRGHERSGDGASVEGAERSGREEAFPRCGSSSPNCATPANCTTPTNNASPICMGDEYHKQSCRKKLSKLSKLSLVKEIEDLVTGSPGEYGGMRESRKRKDITTVRVLFSQHLDVDIVKQQKKILTRLGGAVASTMSDATHFVANEFVRTRNMLEAIASGKPVVTHLWIGSCGEASCLIDEKNYILRDARKEKEFGFCLPVSLVKACQRPLLQGQKVLITANTKPGKEILANLVKAVQGLVIERLGRSALNSRKLPEDVLILSCEEDYEDCVPFLGKGSAIYSSELLLNGIVKQKLEYERHRLFVDHMKRTRSTVWVKKNNRFLRVTK